jgi:hypothetical protein
MGVQLRHARFLMISMSEYLVMWNTNFSASNFSCSFAMVGGGYRCLSRVCARAKARECRSCFRKAQPRSRGRCGRGEPGPGVDADRCCSTRVSAQLPGRCSRGDDAARSPRPHRAFNCSV